MDHMVRSKQKGAGNVPLQTSLLRELEESRLELALEVWECWGGHDGL